jgi:hypothetical protein
VLEKLGGRSSHMRTGLLSDFPANRAENRQIQHFGYLLSILISKTLGFLDIYQIAALEFIRIEKADNRIVF